MEQKISNFSVSSSSGESVALSAFSNKVVLIVNVASKCGFTPQYKGLEELYQKYKDKGFIILGFPCNQFGGQEPGSNEEIQSFCELNYGVSFPVMGKVDVNGPSADPLFQWLKKAAPGLLGTELIKWNFTKFLIDRNGNVAKRFGPQDEPHKLTADIEKLL